MGIYLTSVLAALAVSTPVYHWDYEQAVHHAIAMKRDLVIYFREENNQDEIFRDPRVWIRLHRYVFVCLPVNYEYDGRRLLDYPAFRHMQGRGGVAVVACHDPNAENFLQVISAHPFVKSRYHWVPDYGPEQISLILDFPNWLSLTQRSMLYAVSVHPDKPLSVTGEPHAALMEHCAWHSARQAKLQWQHHADLLAVSHQLQQRAGLVLNHASEVVAESWGRVFGEETVLEAAFSCVDAWRQSPGHWAAVSRPCRYFGYDIQRGANGTWYATGFFGY
ncbi:MAG: hypothetical protein RMI91_03065 [Gemmatales bacterium]|nr:hypothetical protein [Gemmatales bacterium]MDW7993610.1 hypothetical protein [Gemmatales bacterium]